MQRRYFVNGALAILASTSLSICKAASGQIHQHVLYNYWPKYCPSSMEEYVAHFLKANYLLFKNKKAFFCAPVYLNKFNFRANLEKIISFTSNHWYDICDAMANNYLLITNSAFSHSLINNGVFIYSDLLYSGKNFENATYTEKKQYLNLIHLWRKNNSIQAYEKYYDKGYHPLGSIFQNIVMLTFTSAMITNYSWQVYAEYKNDYINDPMNQLNGKTTPPSYWQHINTFYSDLSNVLSLKGIQTGYFTDGNQTMNFDIINKKYKNEERVKNLTTALFKFSTDQNDTAFNFKY